MKINNRKHEKKAIPSFVQPQPQCCRIDRYQINGLIQGGTTFESYCSSSVIKKCQHASESDLLKELPFLMIFSYVGLVSLRRNSKNRSSTTIRNSVNHKMSFLCMRKNTVENPTTHFYRSSARPTPYFYQAFY